MGCEHQYKFQYVSYSHGHQLPGSDACARFYEDTYFCEKCLDTQYRNKRELGNSYSKPIEGSFPK